MKGQLSSVPHNVQILGQIQCTAVSDLGRPGSFKKTFEIFFAVYFSDQSFKSTANYLLPSFQADADIPSYDEHQTFALLCNNKYSHTLSCHSKMAP